MKLTENDTIALFPPGMDAESGERVSAVRLSRCSLGGARIDSCLPPKKLAMALVAFSAEVDSGLCRSSPRSSMTTRSEGSSARFHSKAQPIPLHPRRAYLPDPTTSGRSRGGRNKLLRVMKFGGSSVADAFCIQKVLDIIQAASCESDVVVVVSAMSGVTNTLIEAAARSESGDRERASAIFQPAAHTA